MRKFETGATRDDDMTKPDYARFLSPLVMRRFGEYMVKHRIQANGVLRDPDNWKKGIPKGAYLASLWRHLLALWLTHDGFDVHDDVEENLCAILFNASGYLHEILKAKVPHRATTETTSRADGDVDYYPGPGLGQLHTHAARRSARRTS